MKMGLTRFADWYASRPAWATVLMSALYWYFLLFTGAVIERQVQGATTKSGVPTDPQYFVNLLLAVLVLAALDYAGRQAIASRNRVKEERRRALAYAANLVDECVTDTAATFEKALRCAEASQKRLAMVMAFAPYQANIELVVRRVYDLFQSQYGRDDSIGDPHDFEVTFMTRSYEDGGITIPCYRNRTGRAPRSLLERPGKPGLFDDTVTAECYRDGRPHVRVVEDTMSDPGYKEVYSGQRERIRSSLVCPVLSSSNAILGTLVVHSDMPGFFRRREEKFWRELLERFTRRIALAKAQLDALNQSTVKTVLGCDLAPPF